MHNKPKTHKSVRWALYSESGMMVTGLPTPNRYLYRTREKARCVANSFARPLRVVKVSVTVEPMP